ncbi:PREDICTED: uncharacterized protein LOC107354414 isoform X2 [Acropora digitifera]|uniref:uncharacterized protein LOC107354414 isoform X2 n=1 Tax=Acropora digitifera TaxID=70779 RepID=UPI00077A040B|nr:PREDICTED: uncharacterized protein LOC107354414 isoform X2 [Acropora digitifera]
MLMVSFQKSFLRFLIQVIMINLFRGTATEACGTDVIASCADETTCAQSYGDVYNALASDKNYFNISQALYPAKKPSSVQVYVRLYGATKTENCTPAAYTWSKSCLYAAFPAMALEILSLGSILVASRTQELTVTIPSFCCNVSGDNRKAIIEGVLATLQDLAVSPKIQDPQLNTAECVIEGHKPDISATGRSPFIRAILWFSFIFTVCFGPLLALAALLTLSNLDPVSNSSVTNSDEPHSQGLSSDQTNSAAMGKALKWSAYLVFLPIEVALLISAFVFLVAGKAPWDFYLILVVIILEGLLSGVLLKKGSFHALNFLPRKEDGCCARLLQVVIFVCANLTAYHFCWLIVGIMINPLWGVIVLLFVCVSVAAFIFAVYIYSSKDTKTKFLFSVCAAFVVSVWSLLVVVSLAGQSFYGREGADDVVKLVTLYVTAASFSWILSSVKGGEKSNQQAQRTT